MPLFYIVRGPDEHIWLQSWMESVRKRPTKTCILTKQNAGENIKPKVKYKL